MSHTDTNKTSKNLLWILVIILLCTAVYCFIIRPDMIRESCRRNANSFDTFDKLNDGYQKCLDQSGLTK